MSQSDVRQSHAAAPPPGTIAGHRLVFYWRQTRVFIALATVACGLNIVLAVYQYGNWIVVALLSMAMSWWILWKHAGSMMSVVVGGIFFGVVSGLCVAVIELAWYRQWWYFLNIIRNPFIFVALAGAGCFLMYIMAKSFIVKKINRHVSTIDHSHHGSAKH